MDEQKKQKIVLGVLGALVLGTGTYYFVLRDSGNSRAQAVSTGPVVRKQMDAPAETKSDDVRRPMERRPAAREAPSVQRKTRTTLDRPVHQRKTMRRGARDEVKKKEIKPAA